MNNIVYRATVTQSNGEEKSYIGLTKFKSRLAVHKHSMVNQNENQTALSKHIWELKDKKWNTLLSGVWSPKDRHTTPLIESANFVLRRLTI